MGLLSWLRRQKEARHQRKAEAAESPGAHHGKRHRRGRRHHHKGAHRRISMLSDQTEYYSADELSEVGRSPRAHPIEEESSDNLRVYPSDDDGVVREGDKVLVHPTSERRHSGCLSPSLSVSNSKKRLLVTGRPQAGASFTRRSQMVLPEVAKHCYEEPESTTYMIRGIDYLRTHKKVSSDKAIMQLSAIDMFATDFKLYHIARHMELPTLPTISDEALQRGFLPLLVINLQVPLYNPSYFGSHDGKGGSIIYFFTFPEGWHPDQMENKAAIELLELFFNDGKCTDGTPARDRFKLIPRVANVDEWYKVGPLSTAEYKLLSTYNDKPVLARPQQRFYRGPGYLEVDMDVHEWNFIARKAFFSYIPKLSTVVYENAFVIQGNEMQELPEQILGCVRVYRLDFPMLTSSAQYRFPLTPEDPADCHNPF